MAGVKCMIDFADLVRVGIFPAQVDGGNAPVCVIRCELKRINGGGAVPGTYFACIDGIIAELFICHITVFVANMEQIPEEPKLVTATERVKFDTPDVNSRPLLCLFAQSLNLE